MNTNDLEGKFEELAARIEQRVEEISKRLDERLNGLKSEGDKPTKIRSRKGETPFWGIVLVLVGFIMLGEHIHWFDLDIPILPAALIILGSYLIIENRHQS